MNKKLMIILGRDTYKGSLVDRLTINNTDSTTITSKYKFDLIRVSDKMATSKVLTLEVTNIKDKEKLTKAVTILSILDDFIMKLVSVDTNMVLRRKTLVEFADNLSEDMNALDIDITFK